MKRIIVASFKWGVLVFLAVLVVALARKVPPEDIERYLAALRSGWPWIILAQAFVLAMLLLTFLRWKLLLAAQGIHYGIRDAFALGFIGFFFSQVLPGSTGGDLVKAFYVAVDHPERRAAGITTVFLDRVIGLLDLVALAGVAVLLNHRRILADPWLRGLAGMVLAIIAASIIAGVLFFSERVRSHPRLLALLRRLPLRTALGKVQAAVYIYKFHPGLVLSAVVLSVLVQLSTVAMAASYSAALGLRVDLLSFFFIVPLASLAMALPIGTPGGLGQVEGAYYGLFVCFGHDGQSGLAVALLLRLNWYLMSVFGWLCYLRRKGRIDAARDLAVREGAAIEAEAAAGTPPEGAPAEEAGRAPVREDAPQSARP